MKKNNSIIRLITSATLALTAASALAATSVWSGASGTSTNWSTAGNWSALPTAADDVKFYDGGNTNAAGTVNNFVDSGFSGTIKSLQYGNSNGFHTTLIAPGKSLIVTNGLTVGTGNTNNSLNFRVIATIKGTGGSLSLSNIGASAVSTLVVGQGTYGNGTNIAVLDLSALDTLGGTVGWVWVGRGDSSANRYVNGSLLMARTNILKMIGSATPGLLVGDGADGNTSTGTNTSVLLGQTNAIYCDNIIVGRSKQIGSLLSFNPSFASPSLYLRSQTGGRMTMLAVSDNSAISGRGAWTTNNLIDLSLGTSDIQVGTVYVGRGQNGSGSGGAMGTLTLGAGTLDVNTLELGYINAATAAAPAIGSLNLVSNGTLVVNTSLRLGFRNGAASAIPTGIVNLNGGTLKCFSDIVDGGAFSSQLNVTNGLVDLFPAGDSSPGSITVKTLNLGLAGVITNASTITVSNTLTVAAGGVIAGTNTTIDLPSGASMTVSGFTLGNGQKLQNVGTINGSFTNGTGATLLPGKAGSAGTLTFNNNLALNAGGNLAFDLSNNPNTVGGGVNDLLQVNGSLILNGTNSVTVSGSLTNGVYTLINCASITGGGANYLQIAGALNGIRRQLVFSNSVAGVQLVVSGAAGSSTLVWSGDGAANTWDLIGALNWNSGAEKFYNLDSVIFDDTGSASPAVNLVGTLLPSAVTVNNSSQDYTFAGSGSIAGNAGLTKSGLRSLTISGTNQYTGATVNTAGTLLINGLLAATSAVTNYPGAILGGNGVIAGTLNLAAGSIVTNHVGSPLTVGTLNMAGNAVMNVSTPSVLGTGDYVLMNITNLQGSGQFTTLNISGAGLAPGATNSVVIVGGSVNLHVVATNTPAPPSPFAVLNADSLVTGYIVGSSQTFSNFNSAGADKLVVTVCGESTAQTLAGVTFGGVPMTPAIYKIHTAGLQQAAVYYLDHPVGTGNIVASWTGSVNGAGIGAVALSGTSEGVASTAFDDNSRSVTLTASLNYSFVVAASVGNGTAAYANPPLTQIVGGGDTGSCDGSAGYVALNAEGPLTASFTGSTVRPVTVVAVFGADMRAAYAFSPVDGAVGIATNVTLSWAEGIYVAGTNDNAVYFGDNYAAVWGAEVTNPNGVFKGRQSTNRYSPGTLQIGKTYYWRIDEHNDAIPASPWKGSVHSFTVGLPKYVFIGSMSSNTTVAYLARAITQGDFCNPDNLATFNEDKRMLRNIGAKFIARAAITWDVPHNLTNSLMADYETFFAKIQGYAARMTAEDPEMILQGTLFEIVQSATNAAGVLVRPGVDQVPVPAWVLATFSQPTNVQRNFNYQNMLYSSDPLGQYVNRWGDRSSVPDITRLETKMYFYYRACRFIDAGFESLHMGQIDIMDNNDGTSHSSTIDLFNKIRAYASQHARRGFILLDSDAPYGNIVVNGNLLFDIGSFPLRIKEQCGTSTNGGVYQAILEKNWISSMYGKTVGGITPSGWYCAHVPYNVSFDNSGALTNAPVCGAGVDIWPWGWDEICWFSHNSNAYRNYWLGYAVNWLKTNDNVGYLRPAGRIPISGDPLDINGDGILDWDYRANTPSSACPTGFGQEATIKSLWAEIIAVDDATNTLEDTSVTVRVLANDYDPQGGALTIVGTSTTNGTAVVSGTNVVFTPATNYFGTVVFSYTVSDGTNQATANVTVTVAPVNDAPVANNQLVVTPEDVSTNLVVVASDIDSTNLTYAILAGPTNGTLSILNTNSGAVTYTPATNYTGSDSFTFTVFDGSLYATGLVAITVTPVNDAPVAADDAFSLTQGSPLTVTAPGVLGNDTDVEGDTLSAVLVAATIHGTLALNPNGGFTYTPTISYFGTDSFTYRASDGSATSAVATVSLNIIALPPIQQWRLTYFGTTNATGLNANEADWDGDGLKNIFEYAFNTNPTNANASPMTFSIVSDHLQVVFPRTHPAPADITYLYDVATDLLLGGWNTGPAWTSENVTDNLNGTETVTVTVTPAVSTNSAAFFRLRISQP